VLSIGARMTIVCLGSREHFCVCRTQADAAIDAEVDLCGSGGEWFLRARLNVSLPGVEREVAQALVDAAHLACPYSKATRGTHDGWLVTTPIVRRTRAARHRRWTTAQPGFVDLSASLLYMPRPSTAA
jgi:hypothetical protein